MTKVFSSTLFIFFWLISQTLALKLISDSEGSQNYDTVESILNFLAKNHSFCNSNLTILLENNDYSLQNKQFLFSCSLSFKGSAEKPALRLKNSSLVFIEDAVLRLENIILEIIDFNCNLCLLGSAKAIFISLLNLVFVQNNCNSLENLIICRNCEYLKFENVELTSSSRPLSLSSSLVYCRNCKEILFSQVTLRELNISKVVDPNFIRAVVLLENINIIEIQDTVLMKCDFQRFLEVRNLNQSLKLTNSNISFSSLNTLIDLYDDDYVASSLRTIDFNNLSMQNITADQSLIIFQAPNLKIKLFNLTFINLLSNSKLIQILSSIESTLEIKYITCSNNQYINSFFIAFFGKLDMSNLAFLNNNVNDFSESGPGLLLLNVHKLYLANSTFKYNLAHNINPCIQILHNEEFLLNTLFQSEISVFNCELSDNFLEASSSKTAKSAGISFFVNGVIKIQKLFCNRNTISIRDLNEYAPCIFSNNHETIFYLNESYFFNNTSIMSSNCIFIFAKELYFNGVIFRGNHNLHNENNENSFGGAVAAAADKGYMNNISVINCSATTAAGIGLIMRTDFSFQYYRLSNVLLENNKAFAKGGSLFLQHYDAHTWIYMDVFDSDFINNTAEKEGGAAYIQIENTVLLFQRCNFISNQGLRGGAVFHACLNKESVYAYCNFSFNKALSPKEGGGVFYNMDDQTIQTYYCESNSNSAVYRGGFVQLLKGKYFDYGSRFFNNSAGQDGGNIISHKEVQVIMEKSVIEKGRTKFQGAFIYLMQKSNCSLEKVIVKGVYSPKGGVITIMQESNLTINDLIVSESISDIGAFLYSLNTFEIIKINNMTISNSKSIKTGIFYYVFSYLNITGLTLLNCSGSIFHSVDSSSFLYSLSVTDHFCSNMNLDGGCLLESEISSFVFSKAKLENFSLEGKKSLIILKKQSRIDLTQIVIKKIKSIGDVVLLRSLRSLVNINSSEISNIEGDSGFLFEQLSYLTMINVSIDLSRSEIKAGFLLCIFCINSSISLSEFKGLQTGDKSFLSFVSSLIPNRLSLLNKNQIIIDSSKFIENKATYGGSIYIYDQRLIIGNCEFRSNIAGFGGTILFNCTSNKLENPFCSLLVDNSFFANNSALIAGGVIYSYHLKPEFMAGNKYSENRAPRGDEIFASTPIKLQLRDFPITPKGSGVQIQEQLAVDLIDLYGHLCDYVNEEAIAIISIKIEERTLYKALLGNKMVKAVKGSFNFSGLTIVATPGTFIQLLISVNIISSYSPYLGNSSLATPAPEPDFSSSDDLTSIFNINSHLNLSGGYMFVFPQKVRRCKRGEIYMKSKNICFKCSKGLFSFDPEIEQCFDCPDHMVCEEGDKVLVDKNYWRKNENSSTAYWCGAMNQGCRGGELESQCNLEYIGALCGSCLFNRTHKYFKNLLRNCSDCKDKNLILPIILMFLFVAFLTFQLVLSVRESFQITHRRVQMTASFLTNMMINYLEMVGIVANLVDNIPSSVQYVIFYVTMLFDLENSTGVTDCFIGELAHSSSAVSLYELRQFLINILVLSVFLFPLVILFLLKLVRKGKFNKKTNFLVIIITLFKLMMQPMIKLFSKNFECFTLEDKFYLTINPSMECFKEEHIKTLSMIVFPAMVLLFVFPLASMLFYIIKRRKELTKPEVAMKTWLVTLGYKEKYYYWEYILLLFKIALITTPILLKSQPITSLLVLIIIVLKFFWIQMIFNPYISNKLNNLAQLQYLALFSIYSSSLILTALLDDYIRIIFLILGLIINMVFLLYWIIYFFSIYKEEMKESAMLQQVVSVFSKAFQNISFRKSPKSSIANTKKIIFEGLSPMRTQRDSHRFSQK